MHSPPATFPLTNRDHLSCVTRMIVGDCIFGAMQLSHQCWCSSFAPLWTFVPPSRSPQGAYHKSLRRLISSKARLLGRRQESSLPSSIIILQIKRTTLLHEKIRTLTYTPVFEPRSHYGLALAFHSLDRATSPQCSGPRSVSRRKRNNLTLC